MEKKTQSSARVAVISASNYKRYIAHVGLSDGNITVDDFYKIIFIVMFILLIIFNSLTV